MLKTKSMPSGFLGRTGKSKSFCTIGKSHASQTGSTSPSYFNFLLTSTLFNNPRHLFLGLAYHQTILHARTNYRSAANYHFLFATDRICRIPCTQYLHYIHV